MAGDRPNVFGNVTNVVDLEEGKRVTLEVGVSDLTDMVPDLKDRILDGKARALALVGAGFAKEGFVRNLDFALKLPQLKRRTEIIDKEQIDDNLWSYTINVRPGPILE